MAEAPTWLLVFWGEQDWPKLIGDLVADARPSDADAHIVFSREVDGPRWLLLLVHWTLSEQERLTALLLQRADGLFVNRVEDVS